MFANYGVASRRLSIQVSVALLVTVFFMVGSVSAQNNFNSGSTGADGAFSPATSQAIQVPASGTFNFTTVTIPSGVTITFTRNSANKPLTILASGDVTITGLIVVDGAPGGSNNVGGLGGPGGSNGGNGGYGFDQSFAGVPGDGPGGGGGGSGGGTGNPLLGGGGGGGYGTAGTNGGATTGTPGQGGPKFGAPTLLPLTGGSGGGGGGANNNGRGGAGGGGGGAILVASSGTITLNGIIFSRGGDGNSGNAGGGGGSGGGIRLIANTISGNGGLQVQGGGGGGGNFFSGGSGGQGYVRLEAYNLAFTGTTTPTNVASLSFPHPITPANSPTLRIASVGGVNAPANPAGSLQAVPDVIVPASTPNPVTVAFEASNMPLGTILSVTVQPTRGARTTVQSTGLSGTESASTATANVTLPGGISVISALAVIDLTIAKANPIFMDGERVNRIEVAATFGGPTELTYVTQSGRRIRRQAD